MADDSKPKLVDIIGEGVWVRTMAEGFAKDAPSAIAQFTAVRHHTKFVAKSSNKWCRGVLTCLPLSAAIGNNFAPGDGVRPPLSRLFQRHELRGDGSRIEIGEDALAALRVDLWNRRLVGSAGAYDEVAIRLPPRNQVTMQSIAPEPRRGPGRPPTGMSLIRVEVSRRAAADQLGSNMTEQAEQFWRWAKAQRWGSVRVPAKSTIRKELGPLYKDLRSARQTARAKAGGN